MKGLEGRIAKALNASLCRRGCVFTDRYDARRLNSPREVRVALAYVLLNSKKHSSAKNVRRIQPAQIDSCSSGHYFDGWKDIKPNPTTPSPVTPPKSFLLRTLWKK